MNPTSIDAEIIEWFSHRTSTRWANIPPHWKPRIRMLLDEDRPAHAHWLERHNVFEVRATPLGRVCASFFRLGRAAAPETRTG